jgi:hypothetical protein
MYHEIPVVAGRTVTPCPVFPVENRVIILGLGLFIILFPILPVVISIQSVIPLVYRDSD